MKKKLEVGFYVVALIILVWIFASFIDVNIHHWDKNYEYSVLNFFEMCLRIKGMGLGN